MKARNVALSAALALAMATGCGGKKDDKDKGGDKTGDTSGKPSDDKVKMPTGAATKDARSLQSGQTDWTKLDTKAPEPEKKAGEVKADQIPKTGIVDPTQMHGLTAMSGGEASKPKGFRVAYAPTEKYGNFREAFMKEQLFEKIATALNATIDMPAVVDIQMVDCGTVNAFYDPNSSRIIVCYELLEYYVEMFKPVSSSSEELGNAVIGATFFAFFHELGHGLIHQLDIPSTGQEEDAVDELSTLVLLDSGDAGAAAAMAGAKWFAMEQEKEDKTGQHMPMFDEHGLNGKRFFNVACLVYGSNPDKYQPMVTNNYLPEPRAVRCQEEFRRKAHAWERLLESHVKKNAGTANNGGGQYEAPVQVPTEGQPNAPQPPVAEPPPAQGGNVQEVCDALSKRVLTILVT
ncbi:MAG TPA: DUF4344 domain-containing metallopeptidase, partial [Kofleriaceae bacterium]|nr:DUF4344 domain-containing metallopeptidase [Kofleriaceae bacterium]